MEVFKPVPGHPGYEVSDHGRVRSLDRIVVKHHFGVDREFTIKGKVLKPAIVHIGPGRSNRTPHLKVALGRDNQRQVHQLVMLAFVGPPNGLWINHLDGDGTNNHLSNLEYCTPKRNSEHAVHTGLTPMPPGAGKLTVDDVRAIKSRLLKGETGASIGRRYGVTKEMIYGIKRGKSWAWVS
jgi:hypothetical protein